MYVARAVSTVLDVSVCLLLVGVAVTTLVVAVPTDDERTEFDGGQTADSLNTVTASVPVADDRRAHDTLAGHLAAAALAEGSIDGNRLGTSTYPDAVRTATEEETPERTHITARWRPYPDAPVSGRLDVGPEPPSTADVSVTRRTVDSGTPRLNATDSFGSLATSLSTAYITRMFPPERTRVELVDSRTAERTEARYRAFAETLGVDIADQIDDASAEKANERLADELADRIEPDLRSNYSSAEAAADDETAGNIELVIRRWEP